MPQKPEDRNYYALRSSVYAKSATDKTILKKMCIYRKYHNRWHQIKFQSKTTKRNCGRLKLHVNLCVLILIAKRSRKSLIIIISQETHSHQIKNGM